MAWRRVLATTSAVLLAAVSGCGEGSGAGAPAPEAPPDGDGIGKITPALAGGSLVPDGELEAVGSIGNCTATLIADDMVLTAAHCVCGSAGCDTRRTFTLEAVFPADDPNTALDESSVRQSVSVGGDVRVHPDYEQRGWAREDLAVIDLDQPMSELAPSVQPIPVEEPERTPLPGDPLMLVGYGITGDGCTVASPGKQWLTLDVTDSNYAAIVFRYENQHVCGGDSGGPVINEADRVVGVASWGNNQDSSTYRPTGFSYNWIFEYQRPGWGGCAWVPVEQAGMKSHQPGPDWCAAGSFLVALDLDGSRDMSAHDAPVVGQARCCSLLGAPAAWESCDWMPVQQAGINSHRPEQAWCPDGSYLTQLDLDAVGDASANDSPVVGQARCCRLAGAQYGEWGSSYWVPVELEGVNSHQAGAPWCIEGGFLTQFDLDGNAAADDHDAPVVGQAKCSRPRS